MDSPPLIIVFDSGAGGLSVVDELTKKRVNARVAYAADAAHLPYGVKSEAFLKDRVPALFAELEKRYAPQLFVMACNTASTVAIEEARVAIKAPIVGTVPAIKPAAALTKTGVIGFLGTPGTVEREYSDWLIEEFAAGKTVLRFGSSRLVALAERKIAGQEVTQDEVATALAPMLVLDDAAQMDVGVLACTHFPLLRNEIEAVSPPGLAWIDSGEAIARRAVSLLNLEAGAANVTIDFAVTTGDMDSGLSKALKGRGFDPVEALSL